jgi:hypothetical protein
MKIGMQKVLKVNLIIFHNVRNAPNSFLKIRHVIRDSGKETFVMVMVHKSGQMELSMKVTGDLIKHVGMENSGMLMEMCLKENGSMIRLTAMVFTFIKMERDTKENGKMRRSMDMESTHMLMEGQKKECGLKARKSAKKSYTEFVTPIRDVALLSVKAIAFFSSANFDDGLRVDVHRRSIESG